MSCSILANDRVECGLFQLASLQNLISLTCETIFRASQLKVIVLALIGSKTIVHHGVLDA